MSIFLAGGVTPPAAPSWIIGWKQPSYSFTPEYWVDRSGQRFPFSVAVATTPFFARLPQQRNWFEVNDEARRREEYRPFFTQSGLSLQARLEAKRRDVDPEIDVRRETIFPFPVVVTQTTPFFVYQTEKRGWIEPETFRAQEQSSRPFFVQAGLSLQARLEDRRWNWETPLPTQETLRFPFPTVVVQTTPFFVYQSPQRTWFETNEPARKSEEFRPFFTQNGLNLPLQVEKWSRIEAEGQPRQYDGWGAYRPFWTPPAAPTGWTSAFSVEKWHRIEAEPFRRVSEDGWSAFRVFWQQPPYGGHCAFNATAFSPAFASCREVEDEDRHTPGRVIRDDWWKAKPATHPISARYDKTPSDYADESGKIGNEVVKLRAESARLRIEIVRLEAEINADGVRRLNEQAAIEQKLLFARQAALLVAVHEAVLLEEMEVIDVAYIAAVIAVQTQ